MKPNWRNADDYPRPDDASPAEWAWEFLRRNPEYIDDWKVFKESIGEYADRYPNLSGQEMARFLMDKRYQHVTETGTLSREELLAGAKGTYCKVETPLANWYGSKWGMRQIADPSTTYDRRTHSWIVTASTLKFPLAGFDFDDPRYMSVAIDLTRPLKAQLQQLEIHYKNQRKQRADAGLIEMSSDHRGRFDKYRGYLRALDANAEGADDADVASVLLPHIQNTEATDRLGSRNSENWLERGREMSSGGYRGLLFMTVEEPNRKKKNSSPGRGK
ncbi:transcriptional regulator domain-containing protein [Ralstonia syzygii]|nr:DUF6499 domain-containing protein [Ralstonia syzygii]